MFVFGTRPEAIKMAPLVKACRQVPEFEVTVCTTGQHAEMLQQVMAFFEIEADEALHLMQPNQTLSDITANGLQKLQTVISKAKPDIVLVQGDTTTAFVGALAAFYSKVSVAHVEAGLRSYNKYAPFPEEVNRKMVSAIADFHFAPTVQAKNNLVLEHVKDNIFVTGNTVIDALLWGVAKVRNNAAIEQYFSFLPANKKIILVTAHRRESFGTPFESICSALSQIANQFPDVQLVYPVHLNPNVQEIVHRTLDGIENLTLTQPLDYAHLIWLMDRSYFIITDSGGIQEEAPALGKPVLVIRNVTERTEGIEAGTAKLVGTDADAIFKAAHELLTNAAAYAQMSHAVNPYGDGTSSQNIVSILKNS